MKKKEEILEQVYITASDLKQLIPTMGIENCRNTISEIQLEMEKKGFFVPKSKPKLALTKLVKKKFGIWIERKNMKKEIKEE